MRAPKRVHLSLLATVIVIASLGVVALGSDAATKVGTPITPAPAFTPAELSAPPGNDWVTPGGNIQDNRYSTLNQINTTNVAGLQPAWQIHLNGSCTTAACSGEGNALEYGGTVFVQTGADDVFAVDGVTGAIKWEYTPTWDPGFTKRGGVSRGIAMGEGKLFVPGIDGYITALDMTTGAVVWRQQSGNWHQSYQLTAAPVYYKHEVIIGMSGGDSGNRDFVAAYDSENGDLLWQWYVIPGPGQPGYGTWGSKTSYHVGGGAVWNHVAIDPKLGQVYVGTGNPVPWNSNPAGKQLYTDSLVALNAKTGTVKWSYQTVHHDIWDDDIPAPVILYDAPYRPYKIIKSGTWEGTHASGVKVKYTGPATTEPALAEASKMGFTFILDRRTGKPLIPTPEMKVDQTDSQGLNLSKTQPIPLGSTFTTLCVEDSQWNQPGPDGKPIKHGCTFTPVNKDQYVAVPHDEGEWMPSAFDPAQHTMFTCTEDNRAWAMEAIPTAQQKGILAAGKAYTGIGLTQGSRDGIDGSVTAINLETNKTVWHDKWPDFCYSGTMATAGGLVFVGHNDGHLEAIDSKTGKDLWDSPPNAAGANAPSITYSINGKQYVTILAGGNAHESTPRGDLLNTYALPS
jgi:quinohemoprotein ethanol dehydrogenase